MPADEIVRTALDLAGQINIHTNRQITVETL